ncbi:MAG: glycosyltransferase family 4 protein [Bacteroidales bacterium]|nr:glycosyltransferase family 4 protein [Bacteroidales bacterium]
MVSNSTYRVLWFTNTPSLATRQLNARSNLGGWIESLQKQLQKAPEIELGIVFHSPGSEDLKFVQDGTHYFGIGKPNQDGFLKEKVNKWLHRLEDQHYLNHYQSIIEEFKPEIVHIFGTEQPFGLIHRFNLKVPVIIQIQGNINCIADKWHAGISKAEIFRHSKLRNIILGRGIYHEYFTFLKKAEREKEILEHCKFVIGRTDWDRRITEDMAKESKYFHCEELLRDEFHSDSWEKPADATKSVLFSTLSGVTYKGLETVLMTANLLKNQNSIEFEWQIAGVKGDEEIIDITEKSCKLRFDQQNIHFLGSVNASGMVERLKQSSIYIHPSHIENSPNSVCEAMLLGMPVIATNVGGVPSLITDIEEGILVQDGDADVMAEAILELLNNPGKAIEMGEKARTRAVKRHDPEAVLTTLLQIYQTVKR